MPQMEEEEDEHYNDDDDDDDDGISNRTSFVPIFRLVKILASV